MLRKFQNLKKRNLFHPRKNRGPSKARSLLPRTRFPMAKGAILICQPAIPKLPAARQAWPSAVKVEEILVLVIPGTWTLSVTGFAKAGIKTPLILPCGRQHIQHPTVPKQRQFIHGLFRPEGIAEPWLCESAAQRLYGIVCGRHI